MVIRGFQSVHVNMLIPSTKTLWCAHGRVVAGAAGWLPRHHGGEAGRGGGGGAGRGAELRPARQPAVYALRRLP